MTESAKRCLTLCVLIGSLIIASARVAIAQETQPEDLPI
jgi:hypothetical protein